jgi:hypothetical protein
MDVRAWHQDISGRTVSAYRSRRLSDEMGVVMLATLTVIGYNGIKQTKEAYHGKNEFSRHNRK